MSNVIHVDFGSPKDKEITMDDLQTLSSNLNSLSEYLDSLREQGVDDEDILEVIDAINDKDAYFAADEVVQEFADGWLHQFL